MIELSMAKIVFNTILSLVLNIVLNNLSKYICTSTSTIIKDRLSYSDLLNQYIKQKKNFKITKAYYNLVDNKSKIPDFYIKIRDYLYKKGINKEYKYSGKKISSIMKDNDIVINLDIHIKITNILVNEKDIESTIEIFTYKNNLDINKFYRKIDKNYETDTINTVGQAN